MDRITSTQNPRVKALRALRQRKHRTREGQYLIEGIRIVNEALDLGAPLETLVYAPDLLVSERAQALVERVEPARRLVLAAEVFATLSDRDQPQGIAAVMRIQEPTLQELPLSPDLLVLVAVQLRDPGNLGSVIRTADAALATAVVIVEPSADLYGPLTVRATMGSLYALPIVRIMEEAMLAPWVASLRSAGLPVRVVASSAHGEQVYYDVDYDGPLALLIGNEQRGLPPQLRAEADVTVRLPMGGRATSLNVSAATAAMVFEILRQRRNSGRETGVE